MTAAELLELRYQLESWLNDHVGRVTDAGFEFSDPPSADLVAQRADGTRLEVTVRVMPHE